MKILVFFCLVFVCCFKPTMFSQDETEGGVRKSAYSAYYEKTIKNFQAEDLKKKPSTKAIVVVGSSSVSFWHPTINEDLAPLTLVPRGIAGCELADVLYYYDKLIEPYQPRAVVIYAGENDIVLQTTPEAVFLLFKSLVEKIKKSNPETRIYFVSIKPSVARWALWNKMAEANLMIETECKKEETLFYIDVTTSLLGQDKKPDPNYFKSDKIHLSKKGYEVWTAAIKPILIANEEKFEPQLTK